MRSPSSAPPAPSGGVDGQHGDGQGVVLVQAEPADQFVGQGRLPRSPRAGDAQHRHGPSASGPGQGRDHLGPDGAGLDARDEAGQALVAAGQGVVERGHVRRRHSQVDVALADEHVDHPLEPELLPVGRREDPLDAVGLQLGDLRGDDDPASAPVDLDVAPALGSQPVHQVAEVLHVAALIGADRHPLDVFGDGCFHHVVHRPVVAQVDDLGPLGLQEAAHDVDGGVVAVEQARGGDEAHRMHRVVEPGRAGRARGSGHSQNSSTSY